MLSQQDFRAIAGAIHAANATAAEAQRRGVAIAVQEANLTLAHEIAAHCARVNPRFERRRFMRACGYATKADD